MDVNVFRKNKFAPSGHHAIQGEIWDQWAGTNIGFRKTKVRWVLNADTPDAETIEADGVIEGTDTFVESKSHSLKPSELISKVDCDLKQMPQYERVIGKVGWYLTADLKSRIETTFNKLKYVVNNPRVAAAYKAAIERNAAKFPKLAAAVLFDPEPAKDIAPVPETADVAKPGDPAQPAPGANLPAPPVTAALVEPVALPPVTTPTADANAPAQTAPTQAQNPAQAQNPPAPTKTPAEQLEEAIAAKDAAKIDQLATTAELRTQVIEKVKTDAPFIEKLVAQNRAAWARPALVLAFQLANGSFIKRIATDLASKTDAVKEAIAQSRAGVLVTAIGISGDVEWRRATDAADYNSLVGALPGPIKIKELNDGVWILWGDGVGRDAGAGRLTFSKLYSSTFYAAGDTSMVLPGTPWADQGKTYDVRTQYVMVAPTDQAVFTLLNEVKSIPPAHVNLSKIGFGNQYKIQLKETAPTASNTWTDYSVESYTTSYYVEQYKTVLFFASPGGDVRPIAGKFGKESDGNPTAVGGSLESSPVGLLSDFQNHARHEIGHAVGAKVFKGMAQSGDEFAKDWGGWALSDTAGIIGAYWNLNGETEIDWTSLQGSPKEKIKDLDVADWLIGLIANEAESKMSTIGFSLNGSVQQKLAKFAPRYSGQPLWKYYEAIGGMTNLVVKDGAFQFPGFTPPGDVFIWNNRSEPKGFWTYKKAAYEALVSSHGWYSLASHKEMFAEMYTKKYAGGAAVAGAPEAFFKALEASGDSNALISIAGPAKEDSTPGKPPANAPNAPAGNTPPPPAPPATSPPQVTTPPKLK